MTPSEVIKYAEKHGAKMIDCKFSDFPGVWQHITYPIWRLTEEAFEEGFGFDGPAIPAREAGGPGAPGRGASAATPRRRAAGRRSTRPPSSCSPSAPPR